MSVCNTLAAAGRITFMVPTALLWALNLVWISAGYAQGTETFEFETNADYDDQFKEVARYDAIFRSDAGRIELRGSPLGFAVYDRSATGGSGGNGATGGDDANTDLGPVVLSSWIGGSDDYEVRIRAGYLFYLDGDEANGYLVQVTSTQIPEGVRFEIFEGASLLNSGRRIHDAFVSLDWGTLQPERAYAFKVSADNGTFTADFGSGLAGTSFTDTSPSASHGQVGILLATPDPFTTMHMDVLTISCEAVHRPTDIQLDNRSVSENQPRITEVGRFGTLDPDIASTTFAYALVSGAGDSGNAFFSIDDNRLLTAKSFNFEFAESYSVRVRSTDSEGDTESPLRILEFFEMDTAHFTLTWSVNAGYNYQVQKSRTLHPESWENVREPVVAEDGEDGVTFHLHPDPEESVLFYRILRTDAP